MAGGAHDSIVTCDSADDLRKTQSIKSRCHSHSHTGNSSYDNKVACSIYTYKTIAEYTEILVLIHNLILRIVIEACVAVSLFLKM